MNGLMNLMKLMKQKGGHTALGKNMRDFFSNERYGTLFLGS
jgi:hypothetical protein